MGRHACLAIGVGTVTPPLNQAMRFPYLDGAVFAARAIGDWALKSGFRTENVRIIDDGPAGAESQPVTRERVQQAVDELFPPGAEVVEQLILAFCGHGLTDVNVGAIFWLFSDSLRLKYRVAADLFYSELLLHGVERITLISDACREAPKNIDLMRLDAVRGIIVQGTQVDSPKFDRLAACQDGQLGYMVSDPMSAVPGKCVFSGVIADVLWGNEPTAIVDGVITTATLAACVRSRTSERAREYRLKLNPQCLVDPLAAVVYETARPPPGPAGLQPWPPTGVAIGLGEEPTENAPEDADSILERVRTDTRFRDLVLGTGFGLNRLGKAVAGDRGLSIPEGSKDLLHDLVKLRRADLPVPDKRRRVASVVRRLEADAADDVRSSTAGEVRRRLEEFPDPGDANLIVWGAHARLWSRAPYRMVDSFPGHTAFHVDSELQGMPILVELADGSMTPVVPYASLYTVVTPSATGDVFLAYGQRDFQDGYRRALSAIDDFAAGRLGVHSIDRLAGQLRHGKHADPSLGAICAYLYRAIADYDSIRRMAFFYVAHSQPVPFDIALLGAMRVSRNESGELLLHVPAVKAREVGVGEPALPDYVTQATPSVEASIGGRCPWLALGWDYVKEPRPEWSALVEGLAEHAAAVRRSGCTVLPNETGRKLAAGWGLR